MGSPDYGSQIDRTALIDLEFNERVRVANELAVLAKQAIRQKPSVKEALADTYIGGVREHGDLQHKGIIQVGPRMDRYEITVSNNPLPKNEGRGYTFYSDLVIEGNIAEKVTINPEMSSSCEFSYTADPFYAGESATRNQPMLEVQNNPVAEAAIRQFIDRFTTAEV